MHPALFMGAVFIFCTTHLQAADVSNEGKLQMIRDAFDFDFAMTRKNNSLSNKEVVIFWQIFFDHKMFWKIAPALRENDLLGARKFDPV